MTFVSLVLMLSGLALLFSAIENLNPIDYLKKWIEG